MLYLAKPLYYKALVSNESNFQGGCGKGRTCLEIMEESQPEPDLLCPFCSLLMDGAVILKCCFASACGICAAEAAASKGEITCVACGGRVVGKLMPLTGVFPFELSSFGRFGDIGLG